MLSSLAGLLALGLAFPLQSGDVERAPLEKLRTESPSPRHGPDPGAALEAWRLEHGADWRLRRDRATGRASFLYGGRALLGDGARGGPAALPSDRQAWFDLARAAVGAARPMLGLDPTTLVGTSEALLPLALAGGVDKRVVALRQLVDGVGVENASVQALYGSEGELVALASKAVPDVEDRLATVGVSGAWAQSIARNAFEQATRRIMAPPEPPELVWMQADEPRRADIRLTWRIDAREHQRGGGAARRYWIDAVGPPTILRTHDLVHFMDLSATAMTNRTPGTDPDTLDNPPVTEVLGHAYVSAEGVTATTAADGSFVLPGVDGPALLTLGYHGPFAEVRSIATPAHVATLQATDGAALLLNALGDETATAQANVFLTLNRLRDWIRATNPLDAVMDAPNLANVMLDSALVGGQTITGCNAFYDGISTNYFWAATGCVNTGYSTVVAHEQGHWLNDRYGSGNGDDGFGEGAADVYAMYLFDDPVVGAGIAGPGTMVRSGENTRLFCGDLSPGCHGSKHADGEVLMGAFWKMRRNLKNTLGDELGGWTADTLFNAWMNAFDQSAIESVVLEQLLVLDDDDGIVSNGTPNFAAIQAAFVEQGFPPFELHFFEFAEVVMPEDTLDEAGPYGIALDLTSVDGTAIVSAEIHAEIEGTSSTVPLVALSGTTWGGSLAGVPSPARVRWYVEARDAAGRVGRHPAGAPAKQLEFDVGRREIVWQDDFEGSDDAGWTHTEEAVQDDWMRDAPAGSSGTDAGIAWSDPPAAWSGTRVWGNDLGPKGWNGAYKPSVVNLLASPPVDLSGIDHARLSFQRWLTVEAGVFDRAEVRVDGVSVWRNPDAVELIDTAWTRVELDLAQLGPGADTRVEFWLLTDDDVELGGWNIDDVQFSSFRPSPTAALPQPFGEGLAGSGDTPPRLDSRGQPATLPNRDFRMTLRGGPPHATALVALGLQELDLPFAGGRLRVRPIWRFAANLNVLGEADVPVPLPDDPALEGIRILAQAVVFDPGAPEGLSFTNALEFVLSSP